MSVPAVIGAAFAPLPVIILISAFIALAVLFRFLAKYAYERLEYTREFSLEGAFEGEEIVLTETIVNPTPFPVFGVEAEAYIFRELEFKAFIPDIDRNMQYIVSRFTLMPRMKIKRRHTLICRKRGYYRVESANLWRGKKNRFIECPAEIYVYPQMNDLGISPSPLSYFQGSSVSARRVIPDPFSFSGIRDYRPGDPFSSINFKATARAPFFSGYNSIKVNQRDFCAARNVAICVNFQTDPEGDPIPTPVYDSMMELSLRACSALAAKAVEEGYRVGLAANCPDIRTGADLFFPMRSGREHMTDILRGLSSVRVSAGGSFLHTLERYVREGESNVEYYLLTTFTDPDISEKITALEALGNTVSVITLDRSGLSREDMTA